MTLDIDTYERRKTRLDAAMRDAVSRGDWNLKDDIDDELVELEKEYRELNTDEKEDAASAQLNVLKSVITDLREKSGLHDNPEKYYRIMQGHYVKADDFGRLSVWRSGCRGDRDERKCEWPYAITTDLEPFKTSFRAEALPLFNEMRKKKAAQLHVSIQNSITEIAKLQGDIE